jgi:hypothetical protein
MKIMIYGHCAFHDSNLSERSWKVCYSDDISLLHYVSTCRKQQRERGHKYFWCSLVILVYSFPHCTSLLWSLGTNVCVHKRVVKRALCCHMAVVVLTCFHFVIGVQSLMTSQEGSSWQVGAAGLRLCKRISVSEMQCSVIIMSLRFTVLVVDNIMS